MLILRGSWASRHRRVLGSRMMKSPDQDKKETELEIDYDASAGLVIKGRFSRLSKVKD